MKKNLKEMDATSENPKRIEKTKISRCVLSDLSNLNTSSETRGKRPQAQNWIDLDSEDANDPQMISEYVNEIFSYLRALEKRLMPSPDYMKNQPEINWKMRSILIDWIVESHWKLRLLPETLFLSVNLMDRFLSIKTVSLVKFQLVGIAAILIASKFEEILTPSISNLSSLSEDAYDESEILRAESYMLNALRFDLSFPSPYVFLRRASKADGYDPQTRTMAKYFMEISLLHETFLTYPPSKIAAASLCLSRKVLIRDPWTPTLVHYSGYTEDELIPVYTEILSYLKKPTKYEAIGKKYATKYFLKVSIFVSDYIEKYLK